jgi:coatomer protein complex subunit epsilon
VAELHLGRYDEAEAALQQALEKEPGNTGAIANMAVLSILTGKEPETYIR